MYKLYIQWIIGHWEFYGAYANRGMAIADGRYLVRTQWAYGYRIDVAS